MRKSYVLDYFQNYVHCLLKDERSGHNWWHIQRVRNLAKYIAKREKANLFVVDLIALLHDILDWKIDYKHQEIASIIDLEKKLNELGVNQKVTTNVCDAIKKISFVGAKTPALDITTIEGKVAQDADRLDAIGAIGIARTFTYGGYKGRSIYDPNVPYEQHTTEDKYKNNQTNTINHFYEKLLLLKDRMNTKTGMDVAYRRHVFMKGFLKQFFVEWNMDSSS